MDGLTLGLFIFVFVILFAIALFLFIERDKILTEINSYTINAGSGTSSSFSPSGNTIFIAAKGTTEVVLSDVKNAKGFLFYISNVNNDGEILIKPPSGVTLNSNKISSGNGSAYVWTSDTSIERII